MYLNLEECLRDVFRFGSLRIEPMGNTAAVMQHCENKGVHFGSSSNLTQAEWHANAAMIQAQISKCLNSRLLVAVVECGHGKYVNLPYLASLLVARGICDDVVLAGLLLQHIYSHGKNPRRIWIMDKYDLHDMTFARQRDKIKNHLANWEQQARFKLQMEFKEKGIIQAA